MDLVSRALAGDEMAWRSVVEAIGPAVLAYARARGAADPEDILGDVLLTLVKSLRRFRGDEGGLRGLAIKMAHDRLIDERRRAGRRPPTTSEAPPDMPGREDPQAAVAGSSSVAQALAQLPPAQRELVYLRVVCDLSVEETARIVGKGQGAVRVALHRALHRLRDVLAVGGVTL